VRNSEVDVLGTSARCGFCGKEPKASQNAVCENAVDREAPRRRSVIEAACSEQRDHVSVPDRPAAPVSHCGSVPGLPTRSMHGSALFRRATVPGSTAGARNAGCHRSDGDVRAGGYLAMAHRALRAGGNHDRTPGTGTEGGGRRPREHIHEGLQPRLGCPPKDMVLSEHMFVTLRSRKK
jgi:hypothetical protein